MVLTSLSDMILHIVILPIRGLEVFDTFIGLLKILMTQNFNLNHYTNTFLITSSHNEKITGR